MSLRTYWFTFEQVLGLKLDVVAFGCGISAVDRDDAFRILQDEVFSRVGEFKVVAIREDVAGCDLGENHVFPNMGDPRIRGVWFPLGFTQFEAGGGWPSSESAQFQEGRSIQ